MIVPAIITIYSKRLGLPRPFHVLATSGAITKWDSEIRGGNITPQASSAGALARGVIFPPGHFAYSAVSGIMRILLFPESATYSLSSYTKTSVGNVNNAGCPGSAK